MADIYKGKIVSFYGAWGSGLGWITIEYDGGEQEQIPCENASTVRALDSAFGNVITPGHMVAVPEEAGYFNQEIYFSLDEFGLCFDGFTPVDEASDELIAAYEARE